VVILFAFLHYHRHLATHWLLLCLTWSLFLSNTGQAGLPPGHTPSASAHTQRTLRCTLRQRLVWTLRCL